MGSKNNRCWFERKAMQAVATQVGRGVRIQGGQFRFLRVSWTISILAGKLWACSAGLKNTVPADCCEKKILFCLDVNSISVSELASRAQPSQPAECSQ